MVISDCEDIEDTQINIEALPEEDNEIEISRAPQKAIAWLCFDKDKVYSRNGKEYLKCNQQGCTKELQYNKSTAANLSRHVKNVHNHLIPNQKQGKYIQKTLELKKAKVMPSYTDQIFMEFLIQFFVVEDMSFLTVEADTFRNIIHIKIQ